MSSHNDHRPAPVKRLISSISNIPDKPFPPPPQRGLSYDKVALFAQDVQVVLNQTLPSRDSTKRSKADSQKSVEGPQKVAPILVMDDPTVSSFSLPLLSPHQLNYRFVAANDNSLFIVSRKPYSLLKSTLLKLDNRRYSGVYLRGPVGVGKSYLLYILAAELRFRRCTYRVTYINDCAKWNNSDSLGFIQRELVMTFFDDEIGGKTIVELCRTVDRAKDVQKKMMKLMSKLITYVQDKDLQWIVICDQHNALFASNQALDKVFPFDVINYLSDRRGANIKVIISASANNEGYPTEMKGWFTHDIIAHKFDNDEFVPWCKHFKLTSGEEINPISDEAIDALYWTGGVPYELYLLWHQPANSFHQKTNEYRKNRMTEMGESHAKFCRRLLPEEMNNLKECIARMALGLIRPEILVGMDRQLFDIIREPKEGRPYEFNELIVALNPLARRLLMVYHDKSLLTSLGFVTQLVLSGDYTQDVKGRIAEKYLLTTIELFKKFSFKYNLKVKAGLGALQYDRSIEFTEIIPFSGHKLPPSTSFTSNRSTLFIPESVNYPGYDFFIWDSKTKVISAFQVTIRNPFHSRAKIDSGSAKENCTNWMSYCSATASHVYWVMPEGCVGSKSNNAVGNRVILFESLTNQFPALENLIVK